MMQEVKATRKSSKKKLSDNGAAQLLALVEKSLDDDKAENVIVIDLAGKSSFADYMVIASGRSSASQFFRSW